MCDDSVQSVQHNKRIIWDKNKVENQTRDRGTWADEGQKDMARIERRGRKNREREGRGGGRKINKWMERHTKKIRKVDA